MRLIVKLKIYFDEYLIKLNGISVILLLIFGVFLVSSATAVESQRIYSDSFYMIANHGLGILIGVGMFLIIKRFNYLYFFKFLTPLVLVMIGALFVLPTIIFFKLTTVKKILIYLLSISFILALYIYGSYEVNKNKKKPAIFKYNCKVFGFEYKSFNFFIKTG